MYFYCDHAFIYLRSYIFSVVLQGLTEYHSLCKDCYYCYYYYFIVRNWLGELGDHSLCSLTWNYE